MSEMQGNKPLSPLRAVSNHCGWCCNGHEKEVCNSPECPLFNYRYGKLPKEGPRSALKVIRARCLDCVQGQGEVERCKTTSCTLHPFRKGKNPNYSEETRTKARERACFAKNAVLNEPEANESSKTVESTEGR